MGGLSARPVETLLISRRVSAGKFCTSTTLLSYLLSVKWRKFQYTKLINEFLANFLLYLPYRKCCLDADLTDSTAMQRQRLACGTLTNSPSGRLMSACGQHPVIGNKFCLYARETSVGRLQNYLASLCCWDVACLLWTCCIQHHSRTRMTPHSTRSPSSYQHGHRVNDWRQTAISADQSRDNEGNAQNSALETSVIY